MTLTRSRENSWLGGVCSGLAHYFGWSATRMRIVWVLATIFTAFAGGIVYLVLWFLMPKAQPAAPNYEPAVLQPWRKS